MSNNVLADNYVPQFNDRVFVTVGGFPQPVNPKQCLLPMSAAELVAVLAESDEPSMIVLDANDIVIGHPITYMGGIEKDNNGNWVWNEHGAPPSEHVPHLVFSDGTICNAGLIAQYWLNNPPQPGQAHNVALERALAEIAGERVNQQKS